MSEEGVGTIGTTGEVSFERAVAHPTEQVWDAITQDDQVTQWMDYKASFDATPGARFHVDFGDDGEIEGVVVAADERTRFSHTWDRSVVRWDLSGAREGGTTICFTHTGFPSDAAPGLAAGWHAFLDALEAHLDGRAPTAGRYEALQPTYQAIVDGSD